MSKRVVSALPIPNSLGFPITTCSILIATSAYPAIGSKVSWIPWPGPIVGLLGMRRLAQRSSVSTRVRRGGA